MTGYERLAGTGTLADGSRLVWTVAEGRRGRRWRAVTSLDGAISHVLLLEVDPDGRPTRLELTTRAGMLTLHPDDGRGWLHGNVVSSEGVRHLRLPWSREHGLEVEGGPLATAVTALRLGPTTAVGEGRTIPLIVIGADLGISEATRRFERLGESEWRIGRAVGARGATTISVDFRGIPIGISAAAEWPLEID